MEGKEIPRGQRGAGRARAAGGARATHLGGQGRDGGGAAGGSWRCDIKRPVRHLLDRIFKYVNASGAAEVMAWGWGNLCQQLAGKSGRCVVLAKDRVAVRACGGSDEHGEAPRRGSASAVRMAPSAAQEAQRRGGH